MSNQYGLSGAVEPGTWVTVETGHIGNTLLGSNDQFQAFVYDPQFEFSKVELP